jgi:hypothetical protein
MRTFWKVLSTVLFVAAIASFLVNVSMYWWPDMPSSPNPAEGRIYPLNNHERYTYMNKSEYDLGWALSSIFTVCLGAYGAIYYFVDPFDQKRQHRPLRPTPPWRQMK